MDILILILLQQYFLPGNAVTFGGRVVVEQMTAASSEWPQLSVPHPA